MHDITEMAQDSKLFKRHGVAIDFVPRESAKVEVRLVTQYAKELSWLFYQLEYVFNDEEDLYYDTAIRLKPFLKKGVSLNSIVDFIIDFIAELH